jgi:hypothetical protein
MLDTGQKDSQTDREYTGRHLTSVDKQGVYAFASAEWTNVKSQLTSVVVTGDFEDDLFEG